jgi:glycosyltransferase involved in cell wall biosynthesis
VRYNIGFIMNQHLGNVTTYRNLRYVADKDPDLNNTWHEIYHYKEGGWLETILGRALPFIPAHYSWIARASWEMYRALHHRRYDALMCNANEGVFFTRVFHRIPTLLEFDATPILTNRMPGYRSVQDSKLMALLKRRLKQRMYCSAALLQTWSNWAKRSFVNDYDVPADKVVVIPPGINLQFWKPAPFTPSGAKKRILFVGGDFRRKGGPLLLDWYKTQRPAEVELHIVTREPVDSIPGVIVYRDMRCNTPQLLDLYHKSHLFVLPSLGDCFSVATIEAMGAGLPVIASNVGAIPEIIESGRNGFIVQGNDAAELGAAIRCILDKPAQREDMGRQSRILAEQRFDVEKNARLTLDYLKKISSDDTNRPKF